MTSIEEAVKSALEQTPVDPTPAQLPPPILLPPHVAANICKMLERVQVTGMEAIAWVEAYQLTQRIAVQQNGPGVPFQGLGG